MPNQHIYVYIHPTNYPYGLCFVISSCVLALVDFTYTLQDYFETCSTFRTIHFKCIFFNIKLRILIQILLMCLPNWRSDNIGSDNGLAPFRPQASICTNVHIVQRRIYAWPGLNELTCSVTHICVSELSSIGSDNGLSPGRRQAAIWTNAGILLIRTPGTNFSEILSEIHTIWLRKWTSKCRLRNGGNFVSASMC